MRSVAERFASSVAAFKAVLGNPALRRLELAWAASIVGHWTFLVSVSVYAYEIGGEEAVGLIFLVRLIPAALFAPFAGMLADRYPRERVLLATELTRIVLIGASAAAVFADATPAVVYVLSVAATIAMTPFRSAQAALTPSLARGPEELTAANAVAGGIDSLAVFVGPAIAGFVLATSSTGVAFVLTALLFLVSAAFVARIHVERVERPRAEIEASTILAEALAGFRAIGSNPSLRVMLGLITAQTLVAGALQVYIVVASIELLGLGEGGVGYLNSAIGIGAFIGAVSALSLTGARRLSPAFLLGIGFMGVPLILLGVWTNTVTALLLLGLLGVGAALVDVAGLTIIQRSVPEDVLARVFGVIQMLWWSSIGIGAAVAPALIGWLDTEGALIATGALLVVLVVPLWPSVARIDAHAVPPDSEELRVLGSIPIFSPLPGMTLEQLAVRLVPLRLDPGTMIVREGDAGDRFYIVAEGEVEVSQDGAPLSTLHPGDYFGEIALIRDIPRTATVVARTTVVLYALDREDFLAAVTGHPQSAEAAESVMSARLAGPASTGYRSSTS